MIRNYIKTAFRNISKHRVLSSVNVMGLTIGLVCTILIGIYIKHETSYDKFHANSERLYRVERIFHTMGFHSPITNHLIVSKMADNFPEIESFTRIWDLTAMMKDFRENYQEQEFYLVDNAFFEMFSYPLIKGDKETVLASPNSVVLTPKSAEKYFGNTDVVGKVIETQIQGQTLQLQVTGLMKEFPDNSHLQTEMLVSYKTIIGVFPENVLQNLRSAYLYSYIMFEKGTTVEELNSKLPGFVNENLAIYKESLETEGGELADVFELHLQPMPEIYLTEMPYAPGPQGDINKLYTAGAIALLILIIACINYVNLSTAKSLTRSKEVGLRKVFGANRKRVIIQFVTESILLSLISLLIALVIIESVMPFFNNYLDRELSIGYFSNPLTIALLIGFSMVVGIIAGLYPAFQISAFRPATVLKQKGTSSGNKISGLIRKGLVILQFAISIGLIISVFTMNHQLKYMINKHPGFDKKRVLIIPVDEQQLQQRMESVKGELAELPAFKKIGRASKVFGAKEFGDNMYRTPKMNAKEGKNIKVMNVDEDFISTVNIELKAGRNYSSEFGTDQDEAYVVNEKAVEKLNFASAEEAIGKRIIMHTVNGERPGAIIGVMKDFNYKSLKKEIIPMVFLYRPESTSNLFIKLSPRADIQESIEKAKQIITQHAPNYKFEYSFLDNEFNSNYRDEIKMRKMFTVFTLLAIFIACMGLFGLASFMTDRRTKEIGIRKAIGASSSKLILMLSSQFLKWVLISNIIAWPLVYYLLTKWLQNFAYHVDIKIIYFIIASFITLIIAQFTVFYKAYSAAKTNPVNSLRYE